jgi:hypothetical protein
MRFVPWGCLALVAAAGCSSHEAETRGDGGQDDSQDVGQEGGLHVGAGVAGNCSFSWQAVVSPAIKTVGIVTWSTDLPGVSEAHIDFGLTTEYGMTAPVDLKEPNLRTLLLGMKRKQTYHYRIVASNSSEACASPDQTITTGGLLGGIPEISVEHMSDAYPHYGGFLVTGQYTTPGGTSLTPAYIVDSDGDIVWAWGHPKDVMTAVMSYDGKSMWISSLNFPDTGASVHRVSMDGLSDENLSKVFTGQNHHMTVLPDETVAFIAFGTEYCDDIKEYSPTTGQVRTIVNAGVAQGGATVCVLNYIQYSREDDTLVFSDFVNQTVVKIRRNDGTTVWMLNGSNPDFSGFSWQGQQHGIHILGVDHFMLFNNNSMVSLTNLEALGFPPADRPMGTGDGSIALELQLDQGTKSVTRVWSYKSRIQTDFLGDVQRLPSGNTLVNYGSMGALHEVGPDGTLLQKWELPMGATFGFMQERASLYGPSPR